MYTTDLHSSFWNQVEFDICVVPRIAWHHFPQPDPILQQVSSPFKPVKVYVYSTRPTYAHEECFYFSENRK